MAEMKWKIKKECDIYCLSLLINKFSMNERELKLKMRVIEIKFLLKKTFFIVWLEVFRLLLNAERNFKGSFRLVASKPELHLISGKIVNRKGNN